MKYQKLKKEEEPRRWKSQGVERNLDKKLKKNKKCKSDLKETIKNKIFLMHLYWPGSDIFPRT